MKNLKHLLCAAVCACAAQSAWAQPNNPTPDAYSLATYWEDVKTTRWETAAVFAGATALGIHTWDWGSSKRFKTNPEGWFGKNTGSGGADKLGQRSAREGELRNAGRLFFEHIQVPHTAAWGNRTH